MSSPVWKGHLTIGDIAIAARLFSGPDEQHVELKQIHAHCGAAAGNTAYCKGPHGNIPRNEIGKAVEVDGALIPLAADQLAAIAPKRSDSLPLGFIPAGAVDPLFYAATYYVHPETDDADYAALLEVMRNEKVVAITKLVLNRERWLLIRPGERGLIAHALYFNAEAKRMMEFRTFPAPVIRMRAVFEAMDQARVSFHPLNTQDEYPGRLHALVAQISAAPSPVPPDPASRKPATKSTRAKRVA